MRWIRTLVLAALALGASFALPDSAAVAQDAPGPEPVGDFAFIDNGRGALFSRFGGGYSLANLHAAGVSPQLSSEAALGYLGMDAFMAFAAIGDGSAIVFDIGFNLTGGGLLSGGSDDFGFGDFVVGLDATLALGFRQDLAIETYVMAVVGYRFGYVSQVAPVELEIFDQMWHLAYLQATFRHELIALSGGVGFGQGGLHFHGGPRLWWFDNIWIGAEVDAWITPDQSDLWGGRAFLEARNEW